MRGGVGLRRSEPAAVVGHLTGHAGHLELSGDEDDHDASMPGAPQRTGPPNRAGSGDMSWARQALGRLPWLAFFFLRPRRLRPVLLIVTSWIDGASFAKPGVRRPIGTLRTGGPPWSSRRAASDPRCRPCPSR